MRVFQNKLDIKLSSMGVELTGAMPGDRRERMKIIDHEKIER